MAIRPEDEGPRPVRMGARPLALPARGARERRSSLRRPHDAHVTWTTAGGGCSRTSRLRDLSPRGLSFTSDIALEPGTLLEIRGEALVARALVRNARCIGRDTHVVGVEFDHVRFHDPSGAFVSRLA